MLPPADPFAAFRAAVESRDVDAAVALMADDVTFHSPVVHKPYVGREALRLVLGAVITVFEDFRYTDELTSEDGVHALIFEARVGDRQVQGLDLIRPDADGKIGEFTVMLRPASGLMAVAERMGAALADAGVR